MRHDVGTVSAREISETVPDRARHAVTPTDKFPHQRFRTRSTTGFETYRHDVRVRRALAMGGSTVNGGHQTVVQAPPRCTPLTPSLRSLRKLLIGRR